jgi:hypothetical protein
MIGIALVADGMEFHIPRGYLKPRAINERADAR